MADNDNTARDQKENDQDQGPVGPPVSAANPLTANVPVAPTTVPPVALNPPANVGSVVNPTAGIGNTNPPNPIVGAPTAPSINGQPVGVVAGGENKTNVTTEGKKLTPDEIKLLDLQDQQNATAIQLQKQTNVVNQQKAANDARQAAEDYLRLQDYQAGKQAILASGQQVLQDKMNEYNAQYDAAKAMKFHDYWADKGTGAKILAAISVGLGSLGASLTHGQNTAADIINNAITRDFNQQKAAMEQQWNIVGQAKTGIDVARNAQADALSALDLKEAAARETTVAKYKQKMAELGYTQAQIDGDQNVLKLQQAAVDKKLQVQARLEQNVKSSVDQGLSSIAIDAATGLPVGKGPITPEQQKATVQGTQLLGAKAQLQKLDPTGIGLSNDAHRKLNAAAGIGEIPMAGPVITGAAAAMGATPTSILQPKDKAILAAQNQWLQAALGEEGIGGRRLDEEALRQNRDIYFPGMNASPDEIKTKAALRTLREQQVAKMQPRAAQTVSDQSGQSEQPVGSPVGQITKPDKNGVSWRKIKEGPDSDKKLWEPVKNGK